MTAVYVSATGTSEGSSANSPASPKVLSSPRPSTTYLLKGGDQIPGWQLPSRFQGDLTFSNYGTGRPQIVGTTGILLNLVSGLIDISNLSFVDPTRDPKSPTFKHKVGGYGILSLNGGNSHLHIHDNDFAWFAFHVAVQTTPHQEGTLIERNRFGPCYGFTDPLHGQRSEAVYGEGQYNAVLQDNLYVYSGWYPGVEPANNNQNHSVYWHGGDGQACGPLTSRRNLYYLACASGPTSNTGGIFEQEVIVDCAQCGDGMAAWISSDSGTLRSSTIVNGFYNAISKDFVGEDNRFVLPPFNLSINLDVPAHATGWRSSSNSLVTRRNLALGSTAPVVRQYNLGGAPAPVDDLNLSFPSDQGYADQIRAYARKQFGLA